MNELPLAQAFAFAAATVESNPWCPMERTAEGYIGHGIADRMDAWRAANPPV